MSLREDITRYDDMELALRFDNTEELYRNMRQIKYSDELRDYAETYFTFSQGQWDKLLQTWIGT